MVFKTERMFGYSIQGKGARGGEGEVKCGARQAGMLPARMAGAIRCC